MKMLPKLYKRTETGAIQEWQIVVDGNGFYTIEGQVDGKLTTSQPTKCKSKNQGRANETSNESQALSEAERKWKKQTKRGYVENIENVDSATTYYHPMLAHKYKDYKEDVVYPILVQRKSDGARCIMTRLGAWSRHGEEWVTVPFIQQALKDFFKKFPDAVLDGELYTHKLCKDFNKIMSLIKRKNPTFDDLFEAEEVVEYHVYDAPKIGNLTEKDVFLDRYHLMAQELKGIKHIHIVETYTAKTEEEMYEYYEKFLEDGFEGLIIRVNKPYQNKRTKFLLKVKPCETAEFKIINIRPGKGNKSNMAGHIDFVTKQGKRFTSNIKGTHEYLKELLEKREENIDKIATVEFQNYTPAGIPRFPYMTSIRDYE